VDKTPEQLYKERAKRVEDAIQLKVPDRVPVVISLSFFPAKYTGVTCEDAFYNPAKWREAVKKTLVDFAPDIGSPGGASSGGALEALDFKQMLWPGHGVSPHHTFQFVEGEYMKADEYDTLLQDPSGYILHTHLPRVCGNLASLQHLPPLIAALFSPTMLLGMPGMEEMLDAIAKARQEAMNLRCNRGPSERHARLHAGYVPPT